MQSFEEVKDHYTKTFQAGEYSKATSLAWEMVQKFGFEGVKAVLATQYYKGEEYQFYTLEEAPDDCPWKPLQGISEANYTQHIFTPLKDELEEFITALSQRVQYIFPMYYEQCWYLLYFIYYPPRLSKTSLPLEEKIDIWVGGAPNPTPHINERHNEWNIPDELYKFYQIHDGFGQLDFLFIWGEKFIYTSKQLVPWKSSSGWHQEFQNKLTTDPNHLLAFYEQDSTHTGLYDIKTGNTFSWLIKEWIMSNCDLSFLQYFSYIFTNMLV